VNRRDTANAAPGRDAANEPVHPATREEAVRLLRERADLGRRAGLEVPWSKLPTSVQAALYGIAGQLEYVADFIEADRG
jgi:hypothetical protein